MTVTRRSTVSIVIALATAALLGAAQAVSAQSDTPPAAAEPTPAISWAYTRRGDHPDLVLAEGIRAATWRVDAALYGLNRQVDVDALIEAQQSCGCVRLMTDTTQAGGRSQKAALTRLQAAGVPIKSDRHVGLMHLKVVSVDQAVVYEGSFNPTDPASISNDEVLFRLASPEAAQAFGEEFDAMWTDAQHYRDWSPSVVPTPKPAE